MRALWFPLLLIPLVFLARPAAACPQTAPANITIDVVEAPTVYNRTLSIAELSKQPLSAPRDGSARRSGMEGYDYALGLTDARIASSANLNLLWDIGADGSACAVIESGTVTLNLTTVVYIARDVAPGSCIDREVRRHEQGHVAIAEKVVPLARAKIAAAIATAARPVRGATAEASTAALQARVQAALTKAMSEVDAIHRRRQQAHDTPAEYDKVPKACGTDAFRALLQG